MNREEIQAPKDQLAPGLATRYVPLAASTEDDHAEVLQGMKAEDPKASRAATQQYIVHSGELLVVQIRRARRGHRNDVEQRDTAETGRAGVGLSSRLPSTGRAADPAF